jgi:putative tryptophan/tyrosine transport system substrate-binding protein
VDDGLAYSSRLPQLTWKRSATCLQLGWAEGRDLGLEIRYLNGQLDRTTALVSELIGLGVEILLTEGSQVVQAAREVTSTIPIIFVRVGDAVGARFAATLARPGGKLTGLSFYATEQGEKRLELLREIPAMLWNPKTPASACKPRRSKRQLPS